MTAEKKTYIVSYQRDEFCPFCTNLAIAESESDVKRRYEEKFEGIKCLTIREAKDYEIEPLKRRGCPVVECEHVEQETKSLTAYNEANEREISMMVGKAMCAYANWMDARGEGMEFYATACESEYEATIRCIGMFVKDSIYAIQAYVVGRAETELLAS